MLMTVVVSLEGGAGGARLGGVARGHEAGDPGGDEREAGDGEQLLHGRTPLSSRPVLRGGGVETGVGGV